MSISSETFHFLSVNEHNTLWARLYLPEGQPRGVIQLSHGMCEYFERYHAFAEALCAAGYAVAGHDHVGHGHSVDSPEELGFFAETGGDWVLVEDLMQMTRLIRERLPDVPIILFAHSMGSFIGRRYLSRYGSGLAGAVLCGTAGSQPALPAGLALARSVVATRGAHHRSALLDQLAFGGYGRHFGGPTRYEWLTRDRAVVDRYAADPLCNFRFTAAGFRDLFLLLRAANSDAVFQQTPRALPLLLIAGQEDPVGDFGRGVREVYDRYLASGHTVQLKLYPGCRHELLNELDRDEVTAEVIAFFDSLTHID